MTMAGTRASAASAIVPRVATTADDPKLARVLTDAFLDDPFTVWAWPGVAGRRRELHRFHSVYLGLMRHRGSIWTSEDRSGCAIWADPGRWRLGPVDSLRVAFAMMRGGRLPYLATTVLPGEIRVENAHPRAPAHYYLSVLGVTPTAQGRGVGSALLAPLLDLCDQRGVGAYLESSKIENVPFYERHGFSVRREIPLPRGPSIITMWRDPI